MGTGEGRRSLRLITGWRMRAMAGSKYRRCEHGRLGRRAERKTSIQVVETGQGGAQIPSRKGLRRNVIGEAKKKDMT